VFAKSIGETLHTPFRTMAASISLGLLEQSRKVAWADIELEYEVAEEPADEDCTHQVMRSAARCESSETAKSCSRNSRTRRSRRKSQGEHLALAPKQKPAEPLQPAPVASRPVNRNVVTWSDLMGCDDASPSVASKASTATSSPIPSPPLSARMPCYAAVADTMRSNPLVILPLASASYRHSGHFPAAGDRQSDGRSGAQSHSSTSGSCVSTPSFFPAPHAALPSAHHLQELLQLAAQTPYED